MSEKHGNRYSREFKEEAVRLLATSGKNAKQLARELGAFLFSSAPATMGVIALHSKTGGSCIAKYAGSNYDSWLFHV